MSRDYELIHFGNPWKLQPVFHGCKVIPPQFAHFWGSAQRWIISQQWSLLGWCNKALEAWFAGEKGWVLLNHGANVFFFNPHMAGEPCACHRAIQGFGSQPCYHLSPPFTTFHHRFRHEHLDSSDMNSQNLATPKWPLHQNFAEVTSSTLW